MDTRIGSRSARELIPGWAAFIYKDETLHGDGTGSTKR